VQRLCRVLGVHRSAYYKWLAGVAARVARQAADGELVAAIREQHTQSYGTYGCREYMQGCGLCAATPTMSASPG
jgi:hypothetical protein